MSEIENRVRKVVSEMLGTMEHELKGSDSFQEDLGADSIDKVELTMAFEEEFEIEINDEDAEKIETVQQVIDYLAARTV